MRRVLVLFFAVMVSGVVFAYVPTVEAETVVESSSIENGYPANLTFKVTARADSDITDVTLSYSLTGRGTGALGKPKDLTPARNLSTEVVLQVNSNNNYIPVGSEFVYRWQITTADGSTFTSPDQTFFYLPPGRDWKNVANDFMTVYYHGDRQNLANAYLKAGEETYERIGKQLYNITLTQLPVKVIMFADEAESSQARPGSGGRFDAAVTTCGTKVTNDIVLVIPIACGTSDRTDTLRHEFGHILNEAAGEGSLAKLPSWIDEGAAVYAQSAVGDYRPAFEQAARANRLIPFNQMNVPASNPSQVGVFYGQSWAMVNHLIQKGGPETFGKYMATIKGGRRFDQALTDVYGYADLAAFESEFKAAVGAAPQAQPTARPTATPARTPTARAEATPTRTPAAPATAGGDDDGGIGTGTIVIGGVAVLFVLAAVFAFLISMMLENNRKAAIQKASGTPPPAAPPAWRPPPSSDDGPPKSS